MELVERLKMCYRNDGKTTHLLTSASYWCSYLSFAYCCLDPTLSELEMAYQNCNEEEFLHPVHITQLWKEHMNIDSYGEESEAMSF